MDRPSWVESSRAEARKDIQKLYGRTFRWIWL